MGEGPRHAELMLVGETPGDREDLEGHPFVGDRDQAMEQFVTDLREVVKWLSAR